EVSVASLRRYVRANFEDEVRRTQVVVWRPEVPPGDEAQVDYGYLGAWFDPTEGRNRRVWGFSMVLAHSRYLFLRPVIRMDQAAWSSCHVAALEFMKGVPRRIVPENVPRNIFVVM
ncbi:MAG TPA: hypothetical protein VK283_08755, partial [Acidimicrobiales bacterium]|nr:hypothetical protein [Acidimicrobiales bacterium]